MRMIFILGFVAFAITTMYQDMDVSKWLRLKVDGVLARRGWHDRMFLPDGSPFHRPGPTALAARFLWMVLSCPYCMGWWAMFFAAWYVDWRGLHTMWQQSFWLTLMGGWGLHCLLTGAWKMMGDIVGAIGKLIPDDEYAPDRAPDEAEMEGVGE